MAESAPALDAMNVFPVADSDTGSNLELTLAGIADALPSGAPNGLQSHAVGPADQIDSVVQAAILSAHGNSGAIVAEMFISVCRALERDYLQLDALEPGALMSRLLRTASTAANRAVARPVAGTILTVAETAAEAAEAMASGTPGDILAVAQAAQVAARSALARTPEQLPVLAHAAVVDAGAQGFVLLLDVLVEVLGGEPAQPLPLPAERPSRVAHGPRQLTAEYEVMYALEGATPTSLDQLRGQLSELGNSVLVVGDSAVAQVHAHLSNAGSAIEAALDLGRLSRIRVTALNGFAPKGRTVIAAVAGDGLADAVDALGGVPIRPARDHDLVQELKMAVAQADGDVVVLPNGLLSYESATSLVTETSARRFAVIPSAAEIHGLAALAVHDPTADFDSVVGAMSAAAGHVRHGGVTIAEGPAMTTAGTCRTGDVLGMVEGDVVEVGDNVTEVSWRVVQRLLATDGELLTLITGADAEPELADQLAGRAQGAVEALEVEILHGGQRPYLLMVGLE